MIGKLKGVLDGVGEDSLVLDVGGVGYQVHCSGRTLSSLPSVGEALTLAIETHVREKEIKLFGFANEWERDWFVLLQNVQGVGAKVALAILGTLPPAELANAIALQDKALIARTPGIGPKVALRIVSELKDKAPVTIGSLEGSDSLSGVAAGSLQDAVSALVNLGYSVMQAGEAVRKVAIESGDGVESGELIRLALRELSR